MNEKYLLAKVVSVAPRGERWLAVTFTGGFAGEIDLSPGSLLAWCEAGRLLSPAETDEWIGRHTGTPEKMAS